MDRLSLPPDYRFAVVYALPHRLGVVYLEREDGSHSVFSVLNNGALVRELRTQDYQEALDEYLVRTRQRRIEKDQYALV